MSHVSAEYVQTDIGVFPEEWTITQVAIVSKVVDSLHKTPSFSLDGYAMVRVADIKTGNLNLDTTLKVSKKTFDEFTRNYKPKKTDIVLSRVGSYGVNSYVNTDEEFCIGQNTVVIQPKINSKYLYFMLNSTAIWQQIEDGSYGTGYKSLSLKNINELYLPLPEEKEQTAIAKALSDVDVLISSLEKLIAKKQTIKTATMQQLLTGKKRLPGFGEEKGYKPTELGEIPEDWVIKPLGNVLKIRHGRSQKQVVGENGLYPILATGGEIGRTNIALYSKPSVLIGRKGTIDVPRYMDSPFWTVDTLFYSEINNNIDAKYIFYKFGFIDWYSYSEASGVPSLNAATIEKILQAFPASKDEQTAISAVITNFDEDIELLQVQLVSKRSTKRVLALFRRI